MEKLKKPISLHQASIISGYHQDYLSSLIRKNEIKGQKMGGSWLTTEEEIKNYIFKQKIKNKNWLVRHSVSFARANTSFIFAFIFLLILSVGIYFYNKKYIETENQIHADVVQLDGINKSSIKETPKELKF